MRPDPDGPRTLAVGLAHAPVLAALHALAFADPDLSGPAWDEAAFAQLLMLPGTAAFLALAGEEPAGLVLLRTAADEAEILTIGTIPAARGRGIGLALLRAAAVAACDSGAQAMFLEVAAGNAPAQRLYARSGFETVGRRRGYYHTAAGPVDALVLRRALP